MKPMIQEGKVIVLRGKTKLENIQEDKEDQYKNVHVGKDSMNKTRNFIRRPSPLRGYSDEKF